MQTKQIGTRLSYLARLYDEPDSDATTTAWTPRPSESLRDRDTNENASSSAPQHSETSPSSSTSSYGKTTQKASLAVASGYSDVSGADPASSSSSGSSSPSDFSSSSSDGDDHDPSHPSDQPRRFCTRESADVHGYRARKASAAAPSSGHDGRHHPVALTDASSGPITITTSQESGTSPATQDGFLQGRQEGKVRDWNREFQEIIDATSAGPAVGPGGEDIEVRRGKLLRKLVSEFVRECRRIVKLLVQERALDATRRKLRAVDVGGVAGGTKYIESDILFKFASNTYLGQGDRSSPESYLYPDTGCAMKVANLELIGAMSLMGCRVKQLRFPLIALVDYCGFRVLCCSRLPINDNSLVYGSSDGGLHFQEDDPELKNALQRAAKLLNLRPHVFRSRDDQEFSGVPVCVDMEGHRGTDGRLYVLDFARLFPPTPPLPALVGKTKPRQFLWRHFRPEFLAKYCQQTPISSDALSSFGRIDLSRDKVDVETAWKRLCNEVIPAFAQELRDGETRARTQPESAFVGSDGSTTLSLGQRSSSMKEFQQRLARLEQDIHRRGINFRYVGLLRAHFDRRDKGALWANSEGESFGREIQTYSRCEQIPTATSMLLLAIMLKRCFTGQLRERLRNAIETLTDPENWQRSILDVVTTFCNVLLDPSSNSWSRSPAKDLGFGAESASISISSPPGLSDQVLPGIKCMLYDEAFTGGLSRYEARDDISLRDLLGPDLIKVLLDDTLRIVGARCTPEGLSAAVGRAFGFSTGRLLTVEDFDGKIHTSVKKMDFVLQEEAEGLMRSALASMGSADSETLLQQALRLLETSLAVRPGDGPGLVSYGRALTQYALFHTQTSTGGKYLSMADSFLRSAIQLSPQYLPGLLHWARLHFHIAEYQYSSSSLITSEKVAHLSAAVEALSIALRIMESVEAGLSLDLATQAHFVVELDSLQRTSARLFHDESQKRPAPHALESEVDTSRDARAAVNLELGKCLFELSEIERTRRGCAIQAQASSTSLLSELRAQEEGRFGNVLKGKFRRKFGNMGGTTIEARMGPEILPGVKKARTAASPDRIRLPAPFASPDSLTLPTLSNPGTLSSFLYDQASAGAIVSAWSSSVAPQVLLQQAELHFRAGLTLLSPGIAATVTQMVTFAAASSERILKAANLLTVVKAQSPVPVAASLLWPATEKEIASGWSERRAMQEMEGSDYESTVSVLMLKALARGSRGKEARMVHSAIPFLSRWAEALGRRAVELWCSGTGSTKFHPSLGPVSAPICEGPPEFTGPEFARLFEACEIAYLSSAHGTASTSALVRQAELLLEFAIGLSALSTRTDTTLLHAKATPSSSLNAVPLFQQWVKMYADLRACGFNPGSHDVKRSRHFLDRSLGLQSVERASSPTFSVSGMADRAVDLAASHVVPPTLLDRANSLSSRALTMIRKHGVVVEVSSIPEVLQDGSKFGWSVFTRFNKLVRLKGKTGLRTVHEEISDITAPQLLPLIESVKYEFEGLPAEVCKMPPFRASGKNNAPSFAVTLSLVLAPILNTPPVEPEDAARETRTKHNSNESDLPKLDDGWRPRSVSARSMRSLSVWLGSEPQSKLFVIDLRTSAVQPFKPATTSEATEP